MNDTEHRVRRFLHGRRAPLPEHEPDFEAIAAFVDGGLGWWGRRRMMRHLAACENCRRLCLELSDATRTLTANDAGQRAPAAFPPRWQWAAGATLATILLAVVVMFTLPDRRSGPEQWLAAANEPPIAARWLDIEASVYRSFTDVPPAVALSPRWSVAASTSPELHWRLAPDLAADRAEILVIDYGENLVAAWEVDAAAKQAAWPETATPLRPGREYAWKLTAWTRDGPVTTPFVPFYVDDRAPPPADEAQETVAGMIRAGQFDRAFMALTMQPGLLAPRDQRKLADELGRRLHLTEAERALLEARP